MKHLYENKIKDLLNQVRQLEIELDQFSYAEPTADDEIFIIRGLRLYAEHLQSEIDIQKQPIGELK